MHKRYHGQRQHIIHSLDTLLYQLHTLSFFLSPSIWLYACRIVAQFQCSKPRELDPSRSLRFFFTVVTFFNIPSLWAHTTRDVAEGRAVVLDFIGMAYSPSRFQLFTLDIFILLLQLLLTAISYETSVYYHSEDTHPQDLLLPNSPTDGTDRTSDLPTRLYGDARLSPESSRNALRSKPAVIDTSFVLDLRPIGIMTHFRQPPPPSRNASTNTDYVLPVPNTTPWPLPTGIRMLMRASRQMREARGPSGATLRANVQTEAPAAPPTRERRFPGAMEAPD